MYNVYHHKPNTNDCPFMKSNDKDDEKQKSCSVYDRLLNNKFSQSDLQRNHLSKWRNM